MIRRCIILNHIYVSVQLRQRSLRYILNIDAELPPAPAALVLAGRAFAALACLSAAALRRIMVFGPPGGVGEVVRAEGFVG